MRMRMLLTAALAVVAVLGVAGAAGADGHGNQYNHLGPAHSSHDTGNGNGNTCIHFGDQGED
ncbi:hypothetical protein [Streptomyces sp. NPDC003077]|uniref:hypothetical protein n=1 Tax=Streptomyces sp. NPDC003077 TaxID=3154443 RepID=UPI0033B3857F